MKIRFIYFILFGFTLLNFSSCQKRLSDNTEEVWKTVETRMDTWKKRDKSGQLEIYHPNFRRWKKDLLNTKETFLNNWSLTEMQIVEIKFEKVELQFFNNEELSVAHYIVNEKLEWIGEDIQEDDFIRTKGLFWTENYLISDYYVKEDGNWLYIGGVVKEKN